MGVLKKKKEKKNIYISVLNINCHSPPKRAQQITLISMRLVKLFDFCAFGPQFDKTTHPFDALV